MERDAKFDWTALPYPSYSPDLVPSNFHRFGPMKDGLCRQHFPDDTVITPARKWVAYTGADLYEHSMQVKMHSHWW
jgi:5-formaminoimidazole-4-carboxamide-1-beta-D-ribofuranosyl 5'-monophosphate synthetase